MFISIIFILTPINLVCGSKSINLTRFTKVWIYSLPSFTYLHSLHLISYIHHIIPI